MSSIAIQNQSILNYYDLLTAENEEIEKARKQEVYKKVPEIKKIDDEIVKISLNTFLDGGSIDSLQTKVDNLTAAKLKLLTDAGFSKNYLDSQYHCQACKDTGYIGSERCQCLKNLLIQRGLDVSNLSVSYSNLSFEDFKLTKVSKETINPKVNKSEYDQMSENLSIAKDFVNNIDRQPANLLFMGQTGLGKTFLARIIANEVIKKSKSVIFLTCYELSKIFKKDAFGTETSIEFTEDDVIDCDFLVIDDLGAELNNSFLDSRLNNVISERLSRGYSTLITTNLGLTDIRDNYSERIFSRLTGCYRTRLFLGKDMRRN
ncbi:MAG: ATP-binding protein [Lachnospiraceae bacterium]|nr:ATP-binding protein [Lachnospiraceae bacterium]